MMLSALGEEAGETAVLPMINRDGNGSEVPLFTDDGVEE